MLVIENVSLKFTETPLFKPFSLRIDKGEIALLMAPSGAGKSTLLSWICGMPDPNLHASGAIKLNDKDISALPTEKRRIGIMFQDPLMFPHLSVAGNLAFGMTNSITDSGEGKAASKKHRRQHIDMHLERAGMGGFGDRDPLTLSGGQKARLALLRCLLAEPDALLLDEPFSGLDDKTRDSFATLVRKEIKARNLPVLMVSHDPRDRQQASGASTQVRAVHLTPIDSPPIPLEADDV